MGQGLEGAIHEGNSDPLENRVIRIALVCVMLGVISWAIYRGGK